MIVATVILFLVIGLLGGCNTMTSINEVPVELTGYANFVFGAAVATAVLWAGKSMEDE